MHHRWWFKVYGPERTFSVLSRSLDFFNFLSTHPRRFTLFFSLCPGGEIVILVARVWRQVRQAVNRMDFQGYYYYYYWELDSGGMMGADFGAADGNAGLPSPLFFRILGSGME